MDKLPGQPSATALNLDPQEGARVIAQGKGELAKKMENLAREHDIHILQDFALSQNLSRIPVGTVIPDPVYKGLAAVLDFIFIQEQLRQNPAASETSTSSTDRQNNNETT